MRSVDSHSLISHAVEFLETVPRHVWDRRSLPVPIEDIADSHLGLLIRDVEDMSAAPGVRALRQGARISGLLLPGEREIWVNAAEGRAVPRRRRYTIAHEIAHWVLHRDAADAVRCRAEEVELDRLGQPRDRPERDIEWEANTFGGALLIPPPLLRDLWDGSRAGLDRVADAFAVSRSALEGGTRARVYYHHDWSRASQHYRWP